MAEISAIYEALDNMDDYALMANVKPIGPHKVLTDAIAELEQLRQRVQELTAERDELLKAAESAMQCIGEMGPTKARVEVFVMLQGAIASVKEE